MHLQHKDLVIAMTRLLPWGNLLFQLDSRLAGIVRLSDEEAEHYDTPRPWGRAHMYKDSDRVEESYSSKGYPRGETESPNSQRRGVSSTQGGHYIRPAQFQSSSSVHLGVSQGLVCNKMQLTSQGL